MGLSPQEIVAQMLSKDAFSRELGMELVHIEHGHCVLRMTVQPKMLNGFQIAHGGTCFSLADSALAFAANAFGQHALTIETSLSFIKPALENDELEAEALLLHRSRKLARYSVKIRNIKENKEIALFHATVMQLDKEWTKNNP